MQSVFLIVLMCMSSLAYGQSSSQPSSYGLRNDSKQDQRGSKSTPVFVEAEVISSKSKSDVERDAKEEQEKADRERSAITIAGIAAAIAFAAFLVASVQLGMFLRQLKMMRESLGPAQDAAEAAKLSAESLRRVERAYVFVKVAPNQSQIDMLLGGDRGVLIVFANRGKTPGIPITIKYSVFASDKVPETFPDSAVTRELPNAWAIAAGEDFNFPVTAKLPSGSGIPEEVRTGKLNLYCCGILQYDDVFGYGWNTGFCWRYVPDEHRFKPADSYKLNYHGRHYRL